MSQCVPSWDLEDINPNHDAFKFDYEVAELTWENGQVAMQELSSRRVPIKSQPTISWEKPRAAETLEAIVDQATLQPPYCKTAQVAVEDNEELVPWLHQHTPTVPAGSLNATTATRTSDALVPSSNNSTDEGFAQAHRKNNKSGSSTLVGSCSGNPSALMDTTVVHGGEVTTTDQTNDWSSCRDTSMCRNRTFVTLDTCDVGDRLLTTTSTESPASTSSGRHFSNSKFPDDSVCYCRTQREVIGVKEKKKGKAKSTSSNKRRRTAAIHNQSERKRRDKINQRMKTLQKLVPNSNKTDKASMLEEVIEYIKQLQAQVHVMNMSPMMSLVMHQQQQQQQLQMSMMKSMGIGMGGIDMNSMGLSNISAGFHPSIFMNMPSWNNHVNTNTMTANPMSAFLACQPQAMNMDSYNRMAAMYQHMLNQPCGPFPKNWRT